MRAIQYGVVAQLSVIGMINYLDRATLAIANPLVRQDMGLSVGQMGLLLSAFPLTYALAQLPLGLIIDRLGSRLLLGLGLVVWSLAQCLSGFSGNATQLWALRFMLGVGEAPTLPSSTKVVRRWFASHERGTPVGIFTGANHLGQALAAPVLTLLMIGLGWRWMFVLMGLAGFIAAAAWFFFYRDPADAKLSETDLAHLRAGDTERTAQVMDFALWRRLFAFRTSWGLFLGVFGSSYMGTIYLTWLPGYMEMEHHLSVGKTGLLITVPYACSVVGSVFAGWVSDRLARQGISPINSGRIPFVAGLLGIAFFTVLTAQSSGLMTALLWLSCAMFFGQLSGSCSWIVASAAVPENCLGSFGSIQNFFGYLGGALAPAITGLAVQATGSFTVPLMAGAAISVIGAAIYWFVPNGPITAMDLVRAPAMKAQP
ncbi:MFS transporter [Telmatospirillum sp.]|uniref:MFS transporter n=1 Tax=Telmatospirillum sp. TaxID=2079197 RepID=UPI002849CB17|nr:MFS transporter [Telmatospirillum sp.]MDR3435219.1 MFS transporter [Telmatospirillum sp.]